MNIHGNINLGFINAPGLLLTGKVYDHTMLRATLPL